MIKIFEKGLVGGDTETTGVDVNSPDTRIVTCALISFPIDGSTPVEKSWLLDPEMDIPTGASDVHGITSEMAREHGMDYKAGLQDISNVLAYVISNKIPLVFYNAAFDLSLIRNEQLRWGIDFDDSMWHNAIVIDPFVIDKALDKYRKGKRILSVVSSLYGYSLENAHTAEADIYAAVYVAIKIVPKLFERLGEELSVEDLMDFQTQMFKEQAIGLEEYFRKTDPTKTINKSWPFQDKEI